MSAHGLHLVLEPQLYRQSTKVENKGSHFLPLSHPLSHHLSPSLSLLCHLSATSSPLSVSLRCLFTFLSVFFPSLALPLLFMSALGFDARLLINFSLSNMSNP